MDLCYADSLAENCFTELLDVTTALWGDVWEPFGNVNFTDIGKVVDKFKGIPYLEKTETTDEDGAPSEVRGMLRDNVPPFSSQVNFTDIGNNVDAFKTIAYAEEGPIDCP